MRDWTWQEIEAYDDFMASWANAWLCDNDLKEEKGTTYEGEQHDTGNAEPF